MGEETKHSGDRVTQDLSPREGSHSPYHQSIYSTPRRWFPAAVFFTGIALTLLAAYYASRNIQLRMRARFETAALRARSTMRARFEVYNAMLHGAAGLIAVEKNITREQFRKYIEQLGLNGHYPGVQGIGFAPRVPAPEKNNLVASIRQQGEPHFLLWPASDQVDSFPVICIEPENARNDTALGYDMFTDGVRREAMQRARDTGDTAASGKVTLVQEIEPTKQPGFLIYLPVYQGGVVPETIPERNAKLQGFVFCVFRAGDLFASVFADQTMGSELEIFDSTNIDEADLLFRSAKRTASALPFRKTFQEVTALDVSGRTWTTRFFAQPGTEQAWLVLLLLAGGTLLSCAMFYLTRAEGKARRAAERAAAQLKLSELALRESEERLRRYATELEHRVAERTANLAQSIQSLEGVLYHVAHDLRAPLRSMASFTSILLEEYGPRFDDRGRDYAHRIANAAQRMDGLVQDLLAFGRLAHTAVPVSDINLEAEVNAVIRHFSEEIASCGATVDVCAPLPPVKANTAVLNQILSNLISNALKFVQPETRPRLRIYAEETTSRMESAAAKPGDVPLLDAQLSALEGKFVRLWIEDNGIGIAPEYHDRIFRMFERLHPTGSYPGTGIGLAIVRKGIERMGGRVGVESSESAGSRFWLELPAV